MNLDITSFETVAANLTARGETSDLPHAKSSTQAETNTDLAQLIEKLGATSVAKIEKIIVELQDAKNRLQSKMQRIKGETVRYVTFAELALDTAKIISETVSQLHCTDSQQNASASEVTVASSEGIIPAATNSHHQHNTGGMPLS